MADKKVFLGCIPNHIDEAALKEECEKQGTIIDFFYMQDKVGTDRGWAFVTYEDETEAAVAVAMFNGNNIFPGGVRPIHCKFANEKLKSIEGTVFEAPTQSVTPWQEFTTPEGKPYYYNTLTKETVWEKPAEMQAAASVPQPVPASGTAPAGAPVVPAIVPPSQPALPAIPGGMAGALAANQGSGPMGANIFVFHIPINWTNEDFRAHFQPFGQIISAQIHTDPVTKASKGFGFCSYATPQAATMAIKGMNGFDTKQGKFLKVTIKKGEESYNPDAVSAQNLPIAAGGGAPFGGMAATPALVGIQATVATGHTSDQLQQAAQQGKMLKTQGQLALGQ